VWAVEVSSTWNQNSPAGLIQHEGCLGICQCNVYRHSIVIQGHWNVQKYTAESDLVLAANR